MKLLLAGIVLTFLTICDAQWYKFPVEAYQGAKAMGRAYSDMIEANYKNSDKYFHARGNYDAAEIGPGGKFAAWFISNGRELIPAVTGSGAADSEADQEANRWGRNGGDPNRYRPPGLPSKY